LNLSQQNAIPFPPGKNGSAGPRPALAGLLEDRPPQLEELRARFEQLVDNVAAVVVTSSHNIRLALLGLFAQGHVLLEDLPGVGKTLLAKTIAASIDGEFSRIQFTPDLLPSDITGTSVFDLRHQSFEFVPGPVFANVVLADELNRAGPRTQSALLEAMAEGQVSADGNVRLLPRPFMVIATQNMIESYGTFPLPNSQLDRFMVSMALGLPTPEQEMEILQRAEHGMPRVEPVLTAQEVARMQDAVLAVRVAPSVQQYIVNLAAASRECGYLAAGVSPRGSAALLRACQAWAAFQGRPFVIPEDVQELAPHVWGQRVLVGPDQGLLAGREAIARLLKSVAVPL
jgi:MoxR-like ATPase